MEFWEAILTFGAIMLIFSSFVSTILRYVVLHGKSGAKHLKEGFEREFCEGFANCIIPADNPTDYVDPDVFWKHLGTQGANKIPKDKSGKPCGDGNTTVWDAVSLKVFRHVKTFDDGIDTKIKVEEWYVRFEDRLTKTYFGKRLWFWAFGVGLFLAVMLNINTIAIIDYLFYHPVSPHDKKSYVDEITQLLDTYGPHIPAVSFEDSLTHVPESDTLTNHERTMYALHLAWKSLGGLQSELQKLENVTHFPLLWREQFTPPQVVKRTLSFNVSSHYRKKLIPTPYVKDWPYLVKVPVSPPNPEALDAIINKTMLLVPQSDSVGQMGTYYEFKINYQHAELHSDTNYTYAPNPSTDPTYKMTRYGDKTGWEVHTISKTQGIQIPQMQRVGDSISFHIPSAYLPFSPDTFDIEKATVTLTFTPATTAGEAKPASYTVGITIPPKAYSAAQSFAHFIRVNTGPWSIPGWILTAILGTFGAPFWYGFVKGIKQLLTQILKQNKAVLK